MKYTLAEAAKATGRAKSTIHSAIKKGRISAQVNDIGEYVIDPAELHRVFEPNVRTNDKSNNTGQQPNTELMLENIQLKAKLEAMSDLKGQIEAERDNLREQNTRITALLTSPKENPYAAILERLGAIESVIVSEEEPKKSEEATSPGFWSFLKRKKV